MAEVTPTASAIIGRKEERRAMLEGHAFLDEKTMLLASEIVRQLRDYEDRVARLAKAQRKALGLLAAAITQHGLEGLQIYRAGSMTEVELQIVFSSLNQTRLSAAAGGVGLAQACLPG